MEDASGRPLAGVISPSLVWAWTMWTGHKTFFWFFHPDETSISVDVDGGTNAPNVPDGGCSRRVVTLLNII